MLNKFSSRFIFAEADLEIFVLTYFVNRYCGYPLCITFLSYFNLGEKNTFSKVTEICNKLVNLFIIASNENCSKVGLFLESKTMLIKEFGKYLRVSENLANFLEVQFSRFAKKVSKYMKFNPHENNLHEY